MSTDQLITLGIALYGAILSTVLGIWELAKERRRITMFLQFGEFTMRYSIIITNVGHRPVTLLNLSVLLPDEAIPQTALFDGGDPFPITLADGQHLEAKLYETTSQFILAANGDPKIILRDAENRVYTKYKKK